MVLLTAARRREPSTGVGAAIAEGGLFSQGRHLVQRAVAGLPTDLHRHRVVRAMGEGRSVGRLQPVLPALPLSAADRRLSRPALPDLAAGSPRRHRTVGSGGDARRLARPAASGRAQRRLAPCQGPGAHPGLRRAHPRPDAQGGLQERDDPRQRGAAGEDRRRTASQRAPAPNGPTTPKTIPTTTGNRGKKETFVETAARAAAERARGERPAGVGPGRQHRPLQPPGGAPLRPRGVDGRRRAGGGPSVSCTPRRKGPTTCCRW